jgi:hypothetical protein
MSSETEYATDDATGLTFRIDTTRDEKGELKISVSLCNELQVKEGQVFAFPFTPPISAEQIDRKRREYALFSGVI